MMMLRKMGPIAVGALALCFSGCSPLPDDNFEGSATANIVIAESLPTMPPTGYDVSGQYPAGNTQDVSYYSPSQGANDHVVVYTPPGYDSSKRYPVIYAYPGIGADQSTIFADWCVGAGTVADNLIGQGKIQPTIIVAIDDNNGDVQSDTLNVIIPMIDARYSTIADADHRGLYGYSWGGGHTFNIGCSHLDTFHHLSPSSAAPNKSGDDALFPNGGAEAKAKLKTLFISCGDSDYMGLYGSSLGAHNYCDANGIPNYWLSVAGGNHNAGVWRPAMWNFLQLAFPAKKTGVGVTFYQDYYHGGNAVTLEPGTYTLSQLAAAGIPNDSVSSVRVPSGYTVEVYRDDNFNGAQLTLTADSANFGSVGFNDVMSSVKITSARIASGSYYKLVNVNSGKVLGIKNMSTADGGTVLQWSDNGTADHAWRLDTSSDGYYKITNQNSGKVVGVQSMSTSDGAQVLQWSDNGTADHEWKFEDVGNGQYRISNKNSGKVLDVYGGSTTDGGNVIQWTEHNGNNQRWTLVRL